MNLPDFVGAGYANLSAMPACGLLLLKATLVLMLAWPMHFALARANPRWRVFLWRGVVVGLLMAVAWSVGLPGVKIRVAAPPIVPQSGATGLQGGFLVLDQAVHSRPAVRGGGGQRAVEQAANARPDGAEEETGVTVASRFSWSAVSWQTVLAVIWGGGVLLLAVRLAVGHFRLLGELRDMQAAPEAVVAEGRRIAAALGWRRAVPICSSTRFAVPFLYGVRRPVMVLPDRMCGDCPDPPQADGTVPLQAIQLRGILAHELAHVRSRDTFWNMLVQAVSMVLWFHPLAWRIGSVHRAACDAVCDAVSASYLGDVRDYCRTLARVALYAAEPAASAGLAMARCADIRRRLAMLERGVFSLPLKRRVVVPAAVAAIAVLALVAGLRFALADTPQGAEKTLSTAQATEYDAVPKPEPVAEASAKEQATLASAGAEDVGGKTIRGRVLDEEGKPVGGAEVWLSVYCKPPASKARVQPAKSDAEGWFALEIPATWVAQMSPGSPTSLWAHADGHQLGVEPGEGFSFKSNATDLAVRLKRATDTSFIVLDPQGQPVAGALVQPYYVTYEPTPEEVLRRIEARTDAEGTAKLPAIGQETQKVFRVITKEFGIQDLRYTDPEHPLPAKNVIQLRPAGRVEGRVIADEPQWAKGVRITFNTEMFDRPTPPWLNEGFADVESDEQCLFVVPAIAVGRIFFRHVLVDENLPVRPKLPELTAVRAKRRDFTDVPGIQREYNNVQAGETTVLRFPMMPLVPVLGNVSVKDSGAPIPGMKIHISYGGGWQGADAITDAQGRFTARVLPGSVQLQAMNLEEKYVQLGDISIRPYEVPEQTEEFELPSLEVVRAKSIAGRVIDERDRPIANADICIDEGNRRYGFGKSDAKGQFKMTGVPEMTDMVKAKYEVFLHENGMERRMFGSVVESSPLVVRVHNLAELYRQASLPTLDECTCREELEAKIKAAQERKEWRGDYIVIGRLVLDGPGDVRDVGAQMEILRDGYFAGDTYDLVRPIGFRLHGYAPLNIALKGRSGTIVDLGTIHMTTLPASDLATLSGTIALEGGKDASKASVELTIGGFPVNSPRNGISTRKHWATPIKAGVEPDGRISASGFSPCEYDLTAKAPGYVTRSMTVTFEKGARLDVGSISLERPRQISLTYIVAEKPPFDDARKKNAVIAGGSRWKATTDIYGWDLEFAQVKGDLLFYYSYDPCFLRDLGEGQIEDFSDGQFDTDFKTNPDNMKVQSGHVYLLNQGFWKHWVIFRVNKIE